MNPEQGDYFAAPRAAQTAAPTWAPQTPPWAPQQWSPPTGYPAWTPPASEGESGIGIGEALVVTGLALAASLVLTLGMRGQKVDLVDVALRKGLAYTLFFYLVVGTLVGGYVVARRVRLVWHRGSALSAVTLGIPVGVGGGALAVAINSALSGHLSGDANAELLVGGGGVLRIFLTLVVTAVLAPLVEETVFRAICAGSMLAKGPAAALWVSAVAFSIWHMTPSSLRYYALMGLLLGRLWQKRGLLASMTAHACFNGMLTFAAIAATTGAASYTSHGSLRFELPGGWHKGPSNSWAETYTGPAGAALLISEMPAPSGLTASALLQRLRSKPDSGSAFVVAPRSTRTVDLHGTAAVSADVTVGGQPGHLLMVPANGTAYTIVVETAGSPNGERDWHELEDSLLIAPQG